MGRSFRLKKGYDINIAGAAEKGSIKEAYSSTYAVKPTNFRGIAPIPKMLVESGTDVKAGDALFFDKANPDYVYTSPVSGEFVEVRRGPKRRIDEVVILADKDQRHKDFGRLDPLSPKDDLIKLFTESGAWHFIRQRPFNTTADPNTVPRAIFVSGFSSAPLAPEAEVFMKGREKDFQSGITALSQFAKVHLGVEEGHDVSAYKTVTNADVHTFNGPHPAGNVGVQIHHIDPIRKGEIVWTVKPQDVLVLGKLLNEGIYDPSRVITVAGPKAGSAAGYYRVKQGVQISALTGNADDSIRVISGNVLTGEQVRKDGFLGFYDTQISLIPEGDEYEFFGWLLPSYPRPTRSKSLFGSFGRKKPFNVNTNTHGEKRAFVMSGQYEDVLPMDVYPVQLLKAILANDYDMMEGLGIYEVEEEDLALCEFVCTSKQPVQKILREGIEMIREQS